MHIRIRDFSSAGQKKGNSQERQGELPEPWCDRNGYTLNTTLRWNDKAKSAYKGSHLKKGAALWKFLEYIRKGTIAPGSALLIEHIDRISRLPWQQGLDLCKDIINAGVDIVTLTDGQAYTKDRLANDMGCIFILMVHLCQANEASERKSGLSLDNWKRRRGNAATGKKINTRKPAWINKDGSVDQDKANVVRRIFALACDGAGSKKIARVLNAEGVKPIGKATLWSTGLIQYYLQSRTTLGEIQFKRVVNGVNVEVGEAIPDYYTPIIDPKVFARASREFHERKRHKATGRIDEAPNLFVGLLKNLYDGSTYFYKSGSWTSGQSDVVYSSKRLVPFKGNVGAAGAMNIQLQYETFQADFFKFCREIDLQSVFTPGDKTKQRERLEERQATLIEVEERIRLYDGQVKTSKNKEQWVKRIDAAEDERRIILGEIEQLRSELTTSEGTVFAEMVGWLEDPTCRVKIASSLRLLIDRIDILPIHAGVGAHRRTKYYLYVEVIFSNGQRRFYVTTEKGIPPKGEPIEPSPFLEHTHDRMELMIRKSLFGNGPAPGEGFESRGLGYSSIDTSDRKKVLTELVAMASPLWQEKLKKWLETQ